MLKPLIPIALLAGILSLALVACGGDDKADAPAAAAPAAPAAAASAPTTAAATVEATGTVVKQTFKGGQVAVDELKPVDLSNEGDVVDLTVILHDGAGYIYGAPPYRFQPNDMTLRVGQTVNFTLEFANPDSSQKHTFNVPGLQIGEKANYGNSSTFTYTFDKAGTFHVLCAVYNPMTAIITVQ